MEGIQVNKTRTKVVRADYPFVAFHGLRAVQLVSACIVGAIMYYFDWHLSHDGVAIPWTFILLSASSALTILALVATMGLHLFFGLKPRQNIIVNVILICLWGMGFGLLTWWARGTLGGTCTVETWTNDDGIKVCQCYKALFAFSMFGFLSTVAAFGLDLYIIKKDTRLGKFTLMTDPENKRAFSAQVYDEPKHSVEYKERSVSYPESTLLGNRNTESGAYSQPDEQFSSYDTSYQGAHAHRAFS